MHSNFCFFGVFRRNFVCLLGYLLVIFQIGGVCMTQKDIKLKIQDKISDLIPELSKGRHIEIHLSKDNDVKVFVVDKKILK